MERRTPGAEGRVDAGERLNGLRLWKTTEITEKTHGIIFEVFNRLLELERNLVCFYVFAWLEFEEKNPIREHGGGTD